MPDLGVSDIAFIMCVRLRKPTIPISRKHIRLSRDTQMILYTTRKQSEHIAELLPLERVC